MKKCCGNCKYWKKDKDYRLNNEDENVCKRFPPTYYKNEVAEQVVTTRWDWCGEYQPNK